MATIFHRISTGERFTIQNDSREAVDMFLRDWQRRIEAERTDGQLVNHISIDWSAKADCWWEMISETRGVEKVLARGKMTVRWYRPSAPASYAARIDTAMDGGHNSMGMLKY